MIRQKMPEQLIDTLVASRFVKEGLLNEATGQSYRKEIASRGGSVDAADMLRNFLGREPNDKAFLKARGLRVDEPQAEAAGVKDKDKAASSFHLIEFIQSHAAAIIAVISCIILAFLFPALR